MAALQPALSWAPAHPKFFIGSFIYCMPSSPQIRCVAADIPWQSSGQPCIGHLHIQRFPFIKSLHAFQSTDQVGCSRHSMAALSTPCLGDLHIQRFCGSQCKVPSCRQPVAQRGARHSPRRHQPFGSTAMDGRITPGACHTTLQQTLRLLETSKRLRPAAGRPEVSHPKYWSSSEVDSADDWAGSVSECKWTPRSGSRESHLGPV